jgi:hypothetical protein
MHGTALNGWPGQELVTMRPQPSGLVPEPSKAARPLHFASVATVDPVTIEAERGWWRRCGEEFDWAPETATEWNVALEPSTARTSVSNSIESPPPGFPHFFRIENLLEIGLRRAHIHISDLSDSYQSYLFSRVMALMFKILSCIRILTPHGVLVSHHRATILSINSPQMESFAHPRR